MSGALPPKFMEDFESHHPSQTNAKTEDGTLCSSTAHDFFFSLHRAIFAFSPFHYNNNSPYPHVFKPVFQRLLNMALLHRHTDSLLFQCICSSPNTNHRHAKSPQIISLINVMFSCAFMSICDQPRPDIA